MRKFSVANISRRDIVAANRETAAETRIPFITDVNDEMARGILLADEPLALGKGNGKGAAYVTEVQDASARELLVS